MLRVNLMFCYGWRIGVLCPHLLCVEGKEEGIVIEHAARNISCCAIRHLQIEKNCCFESSSHYHTPPIPDLIMRIFFAPFLCKYTHWLPRFDLRVSFVSIWSTKRRLNENSLVDELPLRPLPSWRRQRRPKQNIEWPSWCFPSFQHPIHQ